MKATIKTFSIVGLAGLAGAVGVIVLSNGNSDASPTVVAVNSTSSGDTADDATLELIDGSGSEPAAESAAAIVTPELPDRGAFPDLVNIEGWLQSDVTSLEELDGQVIAVQFWTLGCSNWQATLPAMQELYEKYADEGLEIVGISSPEFDYEAEIDNIEAALERFDIDWPIALDPTKRTFHSWQEGKKGYWPRVYLIDRQGRIRYDHRGEGKYDEIDAAVQALLAEPA